MILGVDLKESAPGQSKECECLTPPAISPLEIASHTRPPGLPALGVSSRTVYKMVESGELGHIRIRSLIRIRQADIEAYEASRWQPPRDVTAATRTASPVPKRDAFAMGRAMASKQKGTKASPGR